MSTPLRRRAAGMAVAVLALAALPSGAQAAIGGGGAQMTTDRPDLVSATILSVAGGSAPQVQYCFDKNISSVSNAAGDFTLAGYNAATTVSNALGTVAPAGGKCVNVPFGSAALDISP